MSKNASCSNCIWGRRCQIRFRDMGRVVQAVDRVMARNCSCYELKASKKK